MHTYNALPRILHYSSTDLHEQKYLSLQRRCVRACSVKCRTEPYNNRQEAKTPRNKAPSPAPPPAR